ncbi:3-oxo-Delta(4 5)-steroid 5-beta-reductase [Bienertia sinuspersici]
MENGDVPSRYQNVALIVGVTGISGNSLADILQLTAAPGGRWKVYGVARRRQPEWQFHHNHVQYIQCEMVDPEDTQAKLSHLSDVTHIFYVGWVTKSTEAESQVENGRMLRNVLDAVIPNAPNLQHICLQTGQKYALPVPDSLSEIQHEPQFVEDFPREAITNCYYSMEDILCEQVQRKENLTWSIHRPAVMFGFSPYSTRNIVGSLCVYATICKHEGKPLKFPGSRATWDGFSDAADADLVAEQQMWGAIYQQGKSHAFNCSNGDMFKWKDLWKVLADEFGVKFVEFEDGSDSLEEMMREKGPVGII